MAEAAHRRLNRLTGEWVLVSPQRAARPWQGQVEEVAAARVQPYDPGCYLCPGNPRPGGRSTPAYGGTYVFDNDFPALLPDRVGAPGDDGGLFVALGERGICRVVCYSPRHDLTLGQLEPAAVRAVVDVWAEQTAELAALPWVSHVQVFENRGAMMGASNPHPHGQVWAQESLPVEAAKERAALRAYAAEAGSCLLCDYAEAEARAGERVVHADDEVVVVVPFWAAWPYETLLLPRRHIPSLPGADGPARDALAAALGRLTRTYDALFDVPFPYSMGFHQGGHLHAHHYPPLLRSATVRKFMVGYELLAEPQRDLTPEAAAERLRSP